MELTGLKGYSAWKVYNKVAFNLVFIRMFNIKSVAIKIGVKSVQDIQDSEETVEEKYQKLVDLLPAIIEAIEPDDHIVTQAEALALFKEATTEQKRGMLFEALNFVDLSPEEDLKLVSMHKDSNGIHYSKSNIQTMKVDKMVELMMDTLVACAELEIDMSLVSEYEIEQLGKHRVDIDEEIVDVLVSSPELETGSAIGLAIKQTFKKYFSKQ
jgi:hypothetical protein